MYHMAFDILFTQFEKYVGKMENVTYTFLYQFLKLTNSLVDAANRFHKNYEAFFFILSPIKACLVNLYL